MGLSRDPELNDYHHKFNNRVILQAIIIVHTTVTLQNKHVTNRERAVRITGCMLVSAS